MKIIFCTPTGDKGASSRYRVIQLLPYLDLPFEFETFHFLDNETYTKFKENKLLETLINLVFLMLKPLKLLLRVKKGDILFIHRDIYPVGNFFLERYLKFKGVKVIFDLDDAVFIEDTSEISNKKNRILYKLKYGKRYNHIIKIADLIFCGNRYLADYCESMNNNIEILPTLIDLNKVKIDKRKEFDNDRSIVFGWIGNPGNSNYFYKLLPIFERLAESYNKEVIFKCIGGSIDYKSKSEHFNIVVEEWSENTEYESLNNIDVGIMPLHDSEWSRGKCGLKILQYMSVYKPVIVDNVGVNKDIVLHDRTGFLANNIDDWERYIEYFIKTKDIKKVNLMGELGRRELEENYSVQAYMDFINKSITKIG